FRQRMRSGALAGFGGLLLATLLSGCVSSPSSVQVVDRNQTSREPLRSGQHTVQRGDTLYSIAFRYGWDWRELAMHNGIAAPYVIYPGQTIRLGGAPAAPVRVAT